MKNSSRFPASSTRTTLFSLLAAASIIASPASRAATYTWDPNANRSDAAGSGVWNTTLPIWDSGTADVAWPNSSSDTAVFGGADGAYTVTAASGLMAATVTFNASGYTLAGASAASPGNLFVSFGGGSGVINVATGKTLTVGANMTVTGGSGTYINALNTGYAGAVVVNNGGVFNINNGNIGGTFTVGANGTVSGTSTSSTVVSGGTVNINGANASFVVRGLAISSGAVVNLNNGTLDTSSSFGLYVNGGSLNLNGGNYVAGPVSNGTAAGSTVRLNGGVIVSSTNLYGSNLGNSNTSLLVQGGGARFNSLTTRNIQVNNGLLHDSTGPAIDGGLISNGPGTVTLSVAGTYNGGTTVNGGTLVASANGALGTGDASVIATSVSLSISTGVTNPFNNTFGHLTLAGGGTVGTDDNGYLDLTSGANIVVGSLTLGGVTYTSGVFSHANAAEYIAGTGTVTIVPEPGSFALVLVLAGGLGVAARRMRPRATA